MVPSTVFETIWVSAWCRSACCSRPLIRSGTSIIRPCMGPSSRGNVVYPSAMNVKDVVALLELPFPELIYRAQSVHRSHHDPAALQLSTLLSVKTGGCPEDCAYCPQSRRYGTGVEDESLLDVNQVISAAKIAKANGATRFCMGAAWRGPKDRELEKFLPLVEGVKALG